MQISQGYIFRILQHFVTKICNFTNFNKFFTGIYFFPRLKISLTCKLSILPKKRSDSELATPEWSFGDGNPCTAQTGRKSDFEMEVRWLVRCQTWFLQEYAWIKCGQVLGWRYLQRWSKQSQPRARANIRRSSWIEERIADGKRPQKSTELLPRGLW